jgi:hypothetical protein
MFTHAMRALTPTEANPCSLKLTQFRKIRHDLSPSDRRETPFSACGCVFLPVIAEHFGNDRFQGKT